jgi:uncharacterized protein (DUF2062 family)
VKPKKRSCLSNILRRLKIHFLKIYNARGSIHEISLGAAIGAFWGVFPTFGLSTVLSILLYKIIRFNLPVAISAAIISNPLTTPFLYMISYKVGTYFIKTDIKFDLETWKDNISKIGYVMLIGSTIVSTITALLVYYIVKFTIEYRNKVNVTKLNTKTSEK